ncbi:MAG TPA: hypothetical protein VMN36_04315 [Verrucomicrobiales bacterium]|nr:hypothetical protein [Verrucomicrobiales bacterium]
MRIDAFGFHGAHDFLAPCHDLGIYLTLFVEKGPVDANEIDPAFGQGTGEPAQRRAAGLVGRAVHGPETQRFSRAAMDEASVLGGDEAVFSGEGFIQTSKIDRAWIEAVWRRIESEPSVMGGRGFLGCGRRRDRSNDQSNGG